MGRGMEVSRDVNVTFTDSMFGKLEFDRRRNEFVTVCAKLFLDGLRLKFIIFFRF